MLEIETKSLKVIKLKVTEIKPKNYYLEHPQFNNGVLITFYLS